MKTRMFFALFLLLSLMVLGSGSALADTTCSFTLQNAQMKLDGNCVTDETIYVPDGKTLDGQWHTITAQDPVGGHFVGAVVQNEGGTANVKNLTINTSNLANVCDSGDDRLRGIYFKNAGGSITYNTVRNINQGNSGCQEGNAIEARNDGPDTVNVTIRHNTISAYQKTGIVANLNVNATVEYNDVRGFGPVNFIAQNSIQIGWGAIGRVRYNSVNGNAYTGGYWVSTGILLYAPGNGVNVSQNTALNSDVGVYMYDANQAIVNTNLVEKGSEIGILLYYGDGTRLSNNETNFFDYAGVYTYGDTNSTLLRNHARRNDEYGILAYATGGSLVNGNWAYKNPAYGMYIYGDSNTVKNNLTEDNGGVGTTVDGDGNTVIRNSSWRNGGLDIENSGANTYKRNKCDTSSGPPVDCGGNNWHQLRLNSLNQTLFQTTAEEDAATKAPAAAQPSD